MSSSWTRSRRCSTAARNAPTRSGICCPSCKIVPRSCGWWWLAGHRSSRCGSLSGRHVRSSSVISMMRRRMPSSRPRESRIRRPRDTSSRRSADLPLSLKLVSSLATRTPGGAAALLDPERRGFSLLAASDEVIQARAVRADPRPDHRRADPPPGAPRPDAAPDQPGAHPRGAQRAVRPFDLPPEEAAALFEELRRESSLVSVDNADGDLLHRPDLRR